MKLRAVLAFTLLASLACGGLDLDLDDLDGGTDRGAFAGMPNVDLTDPWASMDLPVGGGNVISSKPESIAVTYPGNKVKDLGPKYRDALVGAGWSKVAEVENDGSFVLNYKKDGKTCGLAISFANDMTTVGATIK